MMKVSVVLACFNGLPYIREQLSSIGAQTRLPDELIICDDMSTDGTWEVIQDYARSGEFPISIHRNRSRVGAAMNFSRAALHSTGDIVVFSDQDDLWEATKLESIEAYFEANSTQAIVVHNIRVCDERMRIDIDDYFRYLRRNRYSLVQFTKGCALAARRAVCEIAFPLPPCGSWMHDTRLLALGHASSAVGYLPDRLIRYRVHGTNHSGFVFPLRGYPGKALAWLEALALGRSNSMYRAWSMYRERPITRQVVSEFGYALGQYARLIGPSHGDVTESARVMTAHLASGLNARALVGLRRGLTAKMVGYTACFLRGAYVHSGQPYSYLVDLARAIKHKDTVV